METPLPWLAPHRDTPLDARVLVPSSKSLTNRALVLAAIAEGPSTISRPLVSRDTTLMADGLVALGAQVERTPAAWTVTPTEGGTGASTVECGLAGTVMRFLPAVAALGSSAVTFDGDDRARERPMGTTISSLRALGIDVEDAGRSALPFTVAGTGRVDGGRLELDASASSQFVSALLLAAPRFVNGLDLQHVGPSLPSLPHVEMTVAELRRRGVDVDDSQPDRWRVAPGPVAALDDEIEPDLSNAGVFIGGALATGGRVSIRRWPRTTRQAGDAWHDIVRAFGGSSERDGEDMVFSAGPTLRGVDLDLHDVGELTPVVAAVAALADGPSHLHGIAHLRGHETDRITALATEINRLGGDVTETDDGLRITPRPLHGEIFRTYDDHRMAHAAVVLALTVPELFVENVRTTVKTYPNFAPVWERLVA